MGALHKHHVPSLALNGLQDRANGAAGSNAAVVAAEGRVIDEDYRRRHEPDWRGIARSWVEIRVPGNSPEIKGPFDIAMVRSTLIDIFTHRRDTFVTVIAIDEDGPLIYDGAEYLFHADPTQADLVTAYRSERESIWVRQ